MILLFAGPTLAGLEAALPAGIELRPPAVAGDIARAVRGAERPTAIALVDGKFGTAPSVWHKEILDALDGGIPVLGAASLGALRAAELDGLGMVGVGRVFEAYRSGHQQRDDAVLVAHAPAALGFRPLSLALIDAEHALETLPLAPADRAGLLRLARRMPFHQRSWAALLDAHGAGPGLRARFDPPPPSLKQLDLAELLGRLKAPLSPPPRPAVPRLVDTAHYARLLSSLGSS
jgi:hypothetical protein